MAFAFRQAVPLDQVQLDPSLALQGTADAPAVQPQVPQAQSAAPAAAPDAPADRPSPSQSYAPSKFDIFMDMLANGHTPADAALKVRQRDASVYQMQVLQQALRNAPQDRQLAMLLNPSEEGKALASRDTDLALNGGQTRGTGAGQTPFTATTYGLDPVSGKAYGIGPQMAGGFQTSRAALPGQHSIDAESGRVLDNRVGLTDQFVHRSIITAPGQSLHDVVTSTTGQPSSVDGSNPTASMPFGPQAAAGGSVPALASVTQGKFDPAAFIKSFIMPHEGGLNPHDMNGAPSKYGINQTANPGVDVAHLTPDQATQIYMQKYLPMSGAASLPPALAAVHLDTSIINPQRAQQFLNQSGGDPSKYMDLRDSWMQHMVQNNPTAAPYAKAWGQRNADLRGVIAQSAGTPPPPPPPNDNGPPVQYAAQPGVGGAPLVQGNMPRPLTDPAERARWGIPAQDHTPYIMGPDGRPAASGADLFAPKQQLEYTAQVTGMEPYKNYVLGRGYLGTMQSLMKQPGGFSDLGFIEMAGKTVNPTVAIRPNMIEQYGKETGWPDWLVGQISSVENHGGHLTQEGRNALLNIAQANVQSHWSQLQPILKKVDHDANRYGLTREDLIPDLVPMPDAPPPSYAGAKVPGPPVKGPSPPQSGEVRRGYRFIGGDPGNPRSWSKVGGQ